MKSLKPIFPLTFICLLAGCASTGEWRPHWILVLITDEYDYMIAKNSISGDPSEREFLQRTITKGPDGAGETVAQWAIANCDDNTTRIDPGSADDGHEVTTQNSTGENATSIFAMLYVCLEPHDRYLMEHQMLPFRSRPES